MTRNVSPTFDIESGFWSKGYKLVCGVDEVGRGCFAGPVVAGAVIFPPESIFPNGLKDSKLLTYKKRKILEKEIKESALAWSVAEIGLEWINKIGIGKATQMAFVNVINTLKRKPDFILIDAFYIQNLDKSNQLPVKDGDKLSASIAAGSVIAKVYRDELMERFHEQFPQYEFCKNKGYGTQAHREAIKKYGLCEMHRKSFDLKKFL